MRLKDIHNLELDIECLDIDYYFDSEKPESELLTNKLVSHILSVYRISDSYTTAVCKTKNSYCIILPTKGTMHFNGYTLESSSNSLNMATISPFKQSNFCIKEPQTSFYITIDKLTFDHRCELLLGKKFSDLEEKGFLYLKDLNTKKTLLDLLSQTIKKPPFSDVNDQQNTDTILNAIIHSLHASEKGERTLNYCNFAAVKVHAYLLTQPNDPLSLTEICEATNANRRSIQKGFKELYGMGPVDFHKLYRLHMVRKYLKKNGATKRNLGAIIGNYGFYHPSRFSEYYKRTFGILPSHEKIEP